MLLADAAGGSAAPWPAAAVLPPRARAWRAAGLRAAGTLALAACLAAHAKGDRLAAQGEVLGEATEPRVQRGQLVSEQIAEVCKKVLARPKAVNLSEAVHQLQCVEALTTGSAAIDIWSLGKSWLEDSNYQVLVALMAGLLGLVCAYDAMLALHMGIPLLAAVAFTNVVRVETVALSLSPSWASDGVLFLQAAAAAGLAATVGFEGATVVFGVSLGWVAAYSLGGWVRSLEASVPGIAVFWYQLGALCGFLANTVWRPVFLAVSAPLVGGLCMVSGSGVLLSRALAATVGSVPAFLPAADSCWHTAALELLGPAGAVTLCSCAALPVLLQVLTGRSWVTAGCQLSSLALGTIPQHTGLLCTLGAGGTDDSCPEWVRPPERWLWAVCGCVLWIAWTGFGLCRQLDKLWDWQDRHFWLEAMTWNGQQESQHHADELELSRGEEEYFVEEPEPRNVIQRFTRRFAPMPFLCCSRRGRVHGRQLPQPRQGM